MKKISPFSIRETEIQISRETFLKTMLLNNKKDVFLICYRMQQLKVTANYRWFKVHDSFIIQTISACKKRPRRFMPIKMRSNDKCNQVTIVLI